MRAFFSFQSVAMEKNDRQNNGSSNSNIVPTNKIDDCRENRFKSNRSLTDACNVIKSRDEEKKHRMVNTILKAKTVISVKWHASAEPSQAKRMRASQLSTYLFQIIDQKVFFCLLQRREGDVEAKGQTVYGKTYTFLSKFQKINGCMCLCIIAALFFLFIFSFLYFTHDYFGPSFRTNGSDCLK